MITTNRLLADLADWPACALLLSEAGTVEASNGRLDALVGEQVMGRPLADLLDDGPTAEKWSVVLASRESADAIELIFRAEGMPIAPRAFSLLRRDNGIHLVEHPAHPRLVQLAVEVEETNADLAAAQRALIIERSRLAAALREVERSNRALDEFAHAVSHDLKAPLRAIKDAGEILGSDATTAHERAAYAVRISTLVSQMRRMIDGVFEYARAGRREESRQPIDTRSALAELVDYLGPAGDIIVDLDPELPTIEGDRIPFDQVFRNILSNAFTYRRADGARVSVTAVMERDFAVFSVADNGPGIPAAQIPRIWRLFQTSRPGLGTGIGLAVVRRIVEGQGGSIDVDSIESQGSTFRVRWPLTAAPQPRQRL